MWRDPHFETELALSFQEAVGCEYIWSQIVQIQEAYKKVAEEEGHWQGKAIDEVEPTSGLLGGNFAAASAATPTELPEPDRGQLEEILEISSSPSPLMKEAVARLLLEDKGYFRRLLDVFRKCEDMEDEEGLTLMCRIVRALVQLNEGAIYEALTQDDVVMDVFGALEYDPELAERQEHRKWLQNGVAFKQVVPIRNELVLWRIHQTYRLGYLKDVVMPRLLDDAAMSTLSSMMLFNTMDIISSLQEDASFFEDLFNCLDSLETSDAEWVDLAGFVQELCSLAKQLQPPQRHHLFSCLIQRGFYDAATKFVSTPDPSVRLKAVDIVISLLHHDAGSFRTFLLRQDNHSLLTLLLDLFVDGSNPGLQSQVLDALKHLTDPDTILHSVEKNGFLELLYDNYMPRLVSLLEETSSVSSETLLALTDFLCFCVANHGYRVKYYVLRHGVIDKVLRLVDKREKFLVLAAIRFLRSCLAIKDKFYQHYVMRNDLFQPVWRAFKTKGWRYNMIHSAVLDLLEFACSEKLYHFICYLSDHYAEEFEALSHLPTFQMLRIRAAEGRQPPEEHQHYQDEEQQWAQTAATGEGRAKAQQTSRNGHRFVKDSSMDEREEDYFDSVDAAVADDEDAENAPPGEELPSSGVEKPSGPLRSPHGTPIDGSEEEDDDSILSRSNLRASSKRKLPMPSKFLHRPGGGSGEP